MPLVATNVGGIAEITEGSPVKLIAPDDVPVLANALLELLNNENDTVVTSTALRELVAKRFTVEKMARDISALYSSVSQNVVADSSIGVAVNQV